jgi:hypothetical protein
MRAALPAEERQALTGFLYEEGNPFKMTPNRYRLRLREKDAEFFRLYIQDKDGIKNLTALDTEGLNDSRKNIRANALFFKERLDDLSITDLRRFAQFVLNRCFVVVVWSSDDDSAFRIFSVLNDRGLDLSTADILKAEIIGKIPDAQQDSYSKKWEEWEEALGRDPFRDLFAHIRMIYLKAKPREALLKEFRSGVLSGQEPATFIDDVLVPYAQSFLTIRSAKFRHTHGKPVNHMLQWLDRIDNADWLPPAIRYMSQHASSPSDLLTFFTDLERLAFALMAQRAYVNVRIERYGRLLSAIENNSDLQADGSPLQLTPAERSETLRVLDRDLYGSGIALYVLLRLNEALSEGEASYNYPILSIEHVLPQHPEAGSEWLEWFPTQEARDQYVHRLGNLLLLSRRKNSRAQNYDFAKKKSTYSSARGGSPFPITSGALSENVWTPDVIGRRQQQLMTKAKEIWRL